MAYTKTLLATLAVSALLVAVAVAGWPSLAVAASTYTIARIPSQFDPVWGGSRALGVSDNGVVVGYGWDAYHNGEALRWSNGVSTDLPDFLLPPSPYVRSRANKVSLNGMIAGYSYVDAYGAHAAVWKNGNIIDLGSSGSQAFSQLVDINNNGMACGSDGSAPYVWTEANGKKYLGILPFPGNSSYTAEAYGINNNGVVAGRMKMWVDSHAAIWDPVSGWLVIDAEGNESMANAINDNNVAVVQKTGQNSQYHACVWSALDGLRQMADLNASQSLPYAINNDGVIVGEAAVPASGEYAVVWDDTDITHCYKLQDLVEGLAGSGWTQLYAAYDVNENGQIVGYGLYNNRETGFLLTPTPEPATLSLLALGGLAVLRRRGRK